MYLLIDNSEMEKINFYYRLNTKWVQAIFETDKKKSLLGAIDKLFKKLGVKPSDLQGIAVVMGKGGFTAARIAATVANTLAYALGIPVAAVDSADADIVDSAISRAQAGRYISAKYSGEAHIGKKKK